MLDFAEADVDIPGPAPPAVAIQQDPGNVGLGG